MPDGGENQNGERAAMTAADDRRKWNRRYRERERTALPRPHPLAVRWRRRMVGGRMLDAACGLGRGIAAVGHLFHTVYGIDLSEVAVAQARNLWEERPVRWIVADVTQQPWPAGYFGLVCAFAFTDLPFFRRIQESIQPGGMFLYEGFSPRQREVKPDLNPAWTASPDDLRRLFPGWDVREQGESREPPFRTRFAAIRPAARGA
jgi:SAM-dependent methyltransferase